MGLIDGISAIPAIRSCVITTYQKEAKLMFLAIKKWFVLLATGSFLLQATGGCESQLQTTLLSGAESFINQVISLYIDAAVGSLLNV